MAPRLELFPFRFRDPRTGKWIRARYVAELHEIAARYSEWEIIGPAEIREVGRPPASPLSCSVIFSGISLVEKRSRAPTARRTTS